MITDLPDPWAGMQATAAHEHAMTPAQVDPKSPHGHLMAGVEWLRQRFGGKPNQVLRDHFLFMDCAGRRYWFRDLPEVRRELGMGDS